MSARSGLQAHALDPCALTAAELGSWRELAAAALEPNPFHEPDYVLPAVRHLGERDVVLLVVEQAGEWHACLPVRTMRWWRGLPLTMLSNWRHAYCFLGTPLVRDEMAPEASAELLRGGLRLPGVSFLGLRWVGAGGPVEQALVEGAEVAGLDVVPYHRSERAALRRRPANTYVQEALSSKRRREYRRLRGLLEQELGEPLACLERAGDRRAYRSFLALEAAGWKGAAGTALASRAGDAAFFVEMLERFARLGRLELLSLESGSRTLAMKCNLVAGDGLVSVKIAYDESVGRFSPGIQLELEAVDRFHERATAAWFDSCADADNEMINRLWPDRREITSLTLTARDAKGKLSRRAAEAAGVVRELRRRRG